MIPVGTAEIAARSGAVVAVLAGVIAAKRRDWTGLARGWEREGSFDARSFDREITSTFTEVARYPMRPLLASMLQVGRKSMVDSLDLDIIQSVNAVKISDAWADRYTSEVIDDLGKTNAVVIQQALPNWLSARLPAVAMAQRARELYGLDPRSAAALTSYAGSDAKKKDVRGLVDRYLEHRATVIGNVHTFTALNSGRQMLLSEGIAQGFLKRNMRKVWVTAIDERVCEICGPMDGVAVPILGAFTVSYPDPKTERGTKRRAAKLVVPPVHPNCRCTIVTEDKFRAGIITRTARFEDRGTRHLARLASRAADLILQ